MRILYLSHGHPAFSAGGAERAAYNLYEAMPGIDQNISTVFVAHAGGAADKGSTIRSFRGKSDELLVSFPPIDYFNLQTTNRRVLKKTVETLLQYYRPTVVHVHHVCHIGIEVFEFIKAYDPSIRIVFTVHEYMMICNNFGQMVKTNGRLCNRASPLECSMCFPDISSGDFFLRNEYLRHALRHVDRLHSPSQFLAKRLQDNGFDQAPVAVIENYQPFRTISTSLKTPQKPYKIGYFGQINPFKGVDVLLDVIDMLREQGSQDFHFHFYGNISDPREDGFAERTRQRFARASALCHYHGAYDGESSVQLMSQMDAIVVPSVWWENSPLVIQEAIAAGTPLIGSDIGGVAEKILANKAGVVFARGDSIDLLHKLQGIGALARTSQPADQKPYGDVMQETLQAYAVLYRRTETAETAPAPTAQAANTRKRSKVVV